MIFLTDPAAQTATARSRESRDYANLRLLAKMAIGWMLVGVFRASHEWLFAKVLSHPIPVHHLAAPYVLISISWALLTLIVFGVVYRVPFDRLERWSTLLGIFVPMVAVVAIGAVLGEYFAYQLSSSTASELSSTFFIHEFHPALLDTFVVLGIACAIRIRDAAVRRALLAAELEQRLAEAQMHSLRSQMEPHFLFNALNSISAMVRDAPDEAERMITRLSDLLRMAIDFSRDQLVPLRSEVAFARHYLDVQQGRFRDQLRVVWSIDSEALDRLVPNFLIQPLLENCFKHGISRTSGTYSIEIRAEVAGTSLRVSVADHYQLPKDASPRAGSGIGLANLDARLHALYGEAASLTFVFPSPSADGSIATVEVPLRNSAAAETRKAS